MCFKRDFSFADYNGSNWNAFLLKNCINRALSKETSEKNLGDALIDETAAFLKSQSRTYISDKKSIFEKCADFGGQIDAAVKDIKIYARDLELYDYLKELKKLRTETYLEALKENQKFQRIRGELQKAKAFVEKFGEYDGDVAPYTYMGLHFDEKAGQIRGALYYPELKCDKENDYDIVKILRKGKLSNFYIGDIVPWKKTQQDDYERQNNKIFYFDGKMNNIKAKDLPEKTIQEFINEIKEIMNKDFWKRLDKIKTIETKNKLPLRILKNILAQDDDPSEIYLDKFNADMLHTTLQAIFGNGTAKEVFPAKYGLDTNEKAIAKLLEIDLYQKISSPVKDDKTVFEKIFNMKETELSKVFATQDVIKNWKWMGIDIQRKYQKLINEIIRTPLLYISTSNWKYKKELGILDNVVNKDWGGITTDITSTLDKIFDIFKQDETEIWGNSEEWISGWLIK